MTIISNYIHGQQMQHLNTLPQTREKHTEHPYAHERELQELALREQLRHQLSLTLSLLSLRANELLGLYVARISTPRQLK